MSRKLSNTFLVAILGLAFLLRVFFLGSIPPGLTNDEADIGYDAYSILLTGHDQWNTFLPLTSFKGFGDYRLSLYTYLVVPGVKVFGLSPFAVRFPSAVFGTISVVLIFFLVKKLFEKSDISTNYAGFAAACLMAISPWSIGLSRIGIESNVAITFLLAGLLTVLYALKQPRLLLLASLFFALTFYTYTSYTVFTPLVLIIIFLFFRKTLLKQKKYLVLFILIMLSLVLPLFISRSAAGVRASQVSFINSQDNIGLLANLNDARGSCVEKFPSILCKVFENKQILFGNTFVKNYLNHFSFSFLFLDGTVTQYSILPQRSLFYSIEIIFLLSGLCWIITKKSKQGLFILVLFLIAPIPDAITGEGHYSRASNMLPFIFILESIGVLYLWKITSFFSKTVSRFCKSFVVVCILLSFVSFTISYYSYFPKYYSTYSQYGYENWSQKILQNKDKYDKVYLSKYANDTKQYIYYLFYNNYNPINFQNKKDVYYSTGSNGWVSIDRIGDLYFVDRIPTEQELGLMKDKKILLVSHPTEFPKDFKLEGINGVQDKNGNTLFAFVNVQDLLKYYTLHKEPSLP